MLSPFTVAVVAALLLASGADALAMEVAKPSPGLMPNPTVGKTLYEKNCASCHASDLTGNDKGPPFIHRVYEPPHHGDIAFQLAAINGVRAHYWPFDDMKPGPTVTPDDVAHITAYIRMHQRKAGIH